MEPGAAPARDAGNLLDWNIDAFWSQAETSQSAAIAAGVLPPVTKPK